MRTYRRDARGRFAGGGGGSAPRRLQFKVAYHGTSAEGAKGIKATGYRESTGSNAKAGQGVYLSGKATAMMYPKALRGTDRKEQRLMRHRLGPKALKQTQVTSEGVSFSGGREFTRLTPAAVANRTMIQTPTIRAEGRQGKKLKAKRKARRAKGK